YKADVAATFDGARLRADLARSIGAHHDDVPAFELAFANAVIDWQKNEAANAAALDVAQRYAAWAAHTHDGRAAHRRGVLFRAPRKLDLMRLVPVESVSLNGIDALQRPQAEGLRLRDGFRLTDPGTDLAGALGEAHYCIWCHEQGKDSCAHGLLEKRPHPSPLPQAGEGAQPGEGEQTINPYKKSVFGIT